jgi:hypothetical protein
MGEEDLKQNNQFKQTTETLEKGVEVISDITPDNQIQKEITTEAEKEITIDPIDVITKNEINSQEKKLAEITEKDLSIKLEKRDENIVENKIEEKKDVFKKQEDTGVLKTVRTYQGDIAGILRNQKTSLSNIMTTEKEKQYSLEEKQTKKSLKIKPKNIIIGSLVSIIIMVVGYYGFIFISKILNPPEIIITELKIPTFIFSNYQRELFLKNLKKQTFINGILEEEKTISIPLGSIMQLYPTKEDTTKHFIVEGTEGNKTLLTTSSLFDILEAKNPTSLTRALDPDFILGFHSSLGNKPFLLLTIKSYENTFAGMLDWEKTLYQDFSPIFIREDTKLEEQTIYEFKDIVIMNKDVRAILNKEGKIEFAYSFPNKNNLLITNNESTLEEIFRRINTAGLERTN